ncbi:MAG: polysaccharide deacetylase family protein [Oscillospiraceae bacterium]|nr:polysaccharide deacetylase family protein [Oscillospiraceae bacterium]
MKIIIDRKQITASGICLLLIVFGFFFALFFTKSSSAELMQTHSKPCTNWGLRFTQSGKQPIGNASAEFLKGYNSYFVGSNDSKTLYLTFDAGYENGHTPRILDTLKKYNVKVTFFVVGTYLKSNADLARRMVAEGHIVGNHTFHHPDMSKISSMETFEKEMRPVEEIYKKEVGEEMKKFYRPPRGKFSENNLKCAKKLGYNTIFWSLAYVDWIRDKQPSKEEAFKKLIPKIHPGAIILLHNTSQTNAEILGELIEKWKEMGYNFSTLERLCKNL